MDQFKNLVNKSRGQQNQSRSRNANNSGRRSDYHEPHPSDSSDGESDGLLNYNWSGVISVYR